MGLGQLLDSSSTSWVHGLLCVSISSRSSIMEYESHYHSLHHSSPIPGPFTAGNATLLEHLVLTVVIGIPVLGASIMGYRSASLVYGYVLTFDFLRCLGHCNVEVVPHETFERFPLLRYLIFTPM
ncbi:hypothetical protein AHAS_Ahas10G0143200 [Arachis hypogaea]